MNKLAVLGPKNTFHDIARRKYLPHLEPYFFDTFDEIFQALNKGLVTKALIAIRNSSSGFVGNNLDRIKIGGFSILEEFELPVNLYLGSNYPNTLESLDKIYSHPMAIEETQQYFSKYSHIKFISTASTAGAVEEIKNNNEQHAAVIASKEALSDSGLLVISERIEDEPNNATTFNLIEK
jgi:prephenate dehydratase